MKNKITEIEPMLQEYTKKLKIEVLKAESIIHKESLSSSIFKLQLKDNSYVILKIAFDEKRYFRECYFLNKVKDTILVPKIINTIDPSEKLNGAILMEYLEGNLISSKCIDDNLSFKMGALLAKLHSISCESYGDVAKGESFSKDVSSGILILKKYFEESFNGCKGYVDENLLKRIEKYFYDEIKKIKYLDGPCIIHRDFKPGNIIVKNNQIKGLIDWEIAKNGFAQEDFAQVEYLIWENFPKTKKAFLGGYQSIRKLPNLDIMPLLRVCKAIGAIEFTIRRKTWEGSHKFVFDKNLKYLEKIFL